MKKSDAGRIGGNVTLERYGKSQLAKWGRLGGRPRSPTYDEIRQQQLLEQNNNDKGGNGSSGSVAELRKALKLRRGSSGIEEIQTGDAQITPTGQPPPERKAVSKPPALII